MKSNSEETDFLLFPLCSKG